MGGRGEQEASAATGAGRVSTWRALLQGAGAG